MATVVGTVENISASSDLKDSRQLQLDIPLQSWPGRRPLQPATSLTTTLSRIRVAHPESYPSPVIVRVRCSAVGKVIDTQHRVLAVRFYESCSGYCGTIECECSSRLAGMETSFGLHDSASNN